MVYCIRRIQIKKSAKSKRNYPKDRKRFLMHRRFESCKRPLFEILCLFKSPCGNLRVDAFFVFVIIALR